VFDENVILAHLPASERERVQSLIEEVDLTTRQDITEADQPIHYLHFPIGSAISLLDTRPSGRMIEVAVIGKEGASGCSVALGMSAAPAREMVQIGGRALRASAAAIVALQADLPFLLTMLRRFSGVLFRHAVISVGCSRFHSVEQRLARWLLAHRHRTGLEAFPFTHDFLADQLGVQRNTVTEAMAALQKDGLVRSLYGRVELRNVPELHQRSCECYAEAKAAIDRYVGALSASASLR
jgi:hypothetical protein